MPETNMRISVNGHSQVPPGFRFHPTEEELLRYYLRKKVSGDKIDLDVIRDVDLNKLEPWDIQERCKIGTTPQNDWYFFSHKDKKYPTGTRTNRATAAGFWKATGRDKVIYSNGKRIGMRKTLVFYKGRAPHGQKSDWIMHEYRLDDNISYDANVSSNVNIVMGEAAQGEEGWVVCRIFKKKNHHKGAPEGPMMSSDVTRSKLLSSCNEGALEQILQYMGRSCKEENDNNIIGNRFLRQIDTCAAAGSYQERFMKLPSLESPNNSTTCSSYQPNSIHYLMEENQNSSSLYDQPEVANAGLVTNWAALDRLVASQLNGAQTESSAQLACFNGPTTSDHDPHRDLNELLRSSSSSTTTTSRSNYNSEIDLWTFTRSSSSLSLSSVVVDPLSHVSNTHI